MAYLVGAKQNASETLYFEATFDAPSLASGASADNVITVPGVRFQDSDGNRIDICYNCMPPDAALASVVVQNARVTADNTVTVRLTNASAGAVDLASGTWRFIIGRF